MLPFAPYKIEHLSLNAIEKIPPLETFANGIYAVYWWHNVVLGHLYIEPNQSYTSEVYFDRIKEVILPTIQFYLNKFGCFCERSIELIKQGNFDVLKEHLDLNLALLQNLEVPPKVPISVVICTRNRPQLLHQCLLQLQNLDCVPEEIIVVDNASDDDASQQVVAQFHKIKYVKEPRLGLDFARNTGIKNATQTIVAYLDDDVVVHPKWLYWIWDSFQDESVAALTGLVIAHKLETEAQQIFEKFWSFNRGYVDQMYDAAYFKQTLSKGPPVWEIGAGANMAFRKKVFDTVGLFDELLDVGAAGCNGDSEMWFRILANGGTIVYNPRAVVFHEHRSDIAGLRRQIYFYMRGYTTAALSQQKQVPASGYYRQIFKRLPVHYLKSIKKGFPRYSAEYKTIWEEMKGVFSGLIFYMKNRNRFIHSNQKKERIAE